jgi:hypothetical protein
MKSTEGILGFICGSLLVGVPVIALTSVAMPLSQVNPDSSLLSEAPSNLDSTNTPRNTPARTTTVAPPLQSSYNLLAL